MAGAVSRNSSRKEFDNSAVVAAGAVTMRKGPRGREVLLVHRPKYDDWSFPKGKLDPGEHVSTTATREVLEETGVEIRLGLPLMPQIYAISGGREKRVHYWIGQVVGDDDVSTYEANNEIDRVSWVRVDKAPGRLSYLDDVAVLQQALERPKRTRTLIVVRHGRAVRRKSWEGDDRKRPLTDVGRQQARAISPVLHSYGVARVITSPSSRCLNTVAPYAKSQVISVEKWPTLSEEGASSPSTAKASAELMALKEPAVVCSHRPVLPELLIDLGVSEEPLDPGEMVVLHHRKGKVLATERHLVR